VKIRSGQIDIAHFQPTEVGLVPPAEAFRPVSADAQYVLGHSTTSEYPWTAAV